MAPCFASVFKSFESELRDSTEYYVWQTEMRERDAALRKEQARVMATHLPSARPLLHCDKINNRIAKTTTEYRIYNSSSTAMIDVANQSGMLRASALPRRTHASERAKILVVSGLRQYASTHGKRVTPTYTRYPSKPRPPSLNICTSLRILPLPWRDGLTHPSHIHLTLPTRLDQKIMNRQI